VEFREASEPRDARLRQTHLTAIYRINPSRGNLEMGEYCQSFNLITTQCISSVGEETEAVNAQDNTTQN
jgi:hypothetical protein